MKQIIKVESYLGCRFNLEETSKFLKDRTDLMAHGIAADGGIACLIIKQISYQYFDFEKQEWVVLPNPKQPKIEGVDENE